MTSETTKSVKLTDYCLRERHFQIDRDPDDHLTMQVWEGDRGPLATEIEPKRRWFRVPRNTEPFVVAAMVRHLRLNTTAVGYRDAMTHVFGFLGEGVNERPVGDFAQTLRLAFLGSIAEKGFNDPQMNIKRKDHTVLTPPLSVGPGFEKTHILSGAGQFVLLSPRMHGDTQREDQAAVFNSADVETMAKAVYDAASESSQAEIGHLIGLVSPWLWDES